jgi:hypothetical protein
MRGGSPGKGHRQGLDPLPYGDQRDQRDPMADSALAAAEFAAGTANLWRLLDQHFLPTLDDDQQRVYDLAFRRWLSGQALAESLGVPVSQAKNRLDHVRSLTIAGVPALLLFLRGRGRCPELDQILAAGGPWFSKALRERIVRHFDDCPACANCPTCRVVKERLLIELRPALIPILFLGDLRAKILQTIRQLGYQTTPARPSDPGSPGSVSRRPRTWSLLPLVLLLLVLLPLLGSGQ